MTFPEHLTLRRIRLVSGLIMFVYLTIHLLNHALGLISLTLAQSALNVEAAVWRNSVATVLLYGAAFVHFSLALWTLYSRREWHLPWIEILRLLAGFTFPLLLIGHAVTTRLGDALYDMPPSYVSIITNLLTEGTQGLQLALLAPGWLHGCLGLWITLRHYETMQRLKPWLIVLVFFVPLLAAAGFVHMAAMVEALGPPAPSSAETLAAKAALAAWKDWITDWYLATIAAAFLLGRVRALVTARSA